MNRCCPFCGAEYAVVDRRCPDCHVALDDPPEPTLPEEQPDDEVVFEIDDWPVEGRVRLTSVLAERAIASRWEAGPAIVVLEADSEPAERILDEVESELDVDDGAGPGLDEDDDDGAADGDGDGGDGEEDEEDEEDGALAQAAMGDMFVAADRLMHDPTDASVADDLRESAATVDELPPPFGFEERQWARVSELAAALIADISTGYEEAVVTSAAVLRDYLRPLV